MNRWLLTAEHAGNEVPKRWQPLFDQNPEVLNTHEGYDPGTKGLTKLLAPLADATFTYPFTRLLVEVNRSARHPKLFSIYSKPLSSQDKEELMRAYYKPHWEAITEQIDKWIKNRDSVYHIGVHSFTTVLNDHRRNTEIGLLYDPARTQEKVWALHWKALLEKHNIKVRRNYPYLGKSDGLITQMRRRFPKRYYGIELELNQALLADWNTFTQETTQAIHSTLTEIQIWINQNK